MNLRELLKRETYRRRPWIAAALVLIISVASVGALLVYTGTLSGGQTSTGCFNGSCTTQVLSTTTTTTTTETTSIPTTLKTTTTLTTTSSVVSTTTTTTTYSGNSSGIRLGFWLQEGDVMQHYTASTFFNAMFLTPPYPSSIEVMIFAISQAQINGQPCSSASSYITRSESYWGQVAQLAAAYPNIRLVYEIAFVPGSNTYGVSCFGSMVQSFAKYPSIYAIGVEGEYTRPASNLTLAMMQSAMDYVTSAGKVFVSYYVGPSLIPGGGYYIGHTNFPGGDAGGYDQVGTLQLYNSGNSIGLDSGYYATFPFPSSVTCPIGSSAMDSTTAGWNQCVEQTELSAAIAQPAGSRQFLEVDGGFSQAYFTGVSGQSTNQLWDNPTLRSWFWTDSSYATHFVLSTPG